MSESSSINSDAYWDRRFSDDWEAYEGPRQSRFFAQLAVDNLPTWIFEQIRLQELSVVDWGSAQGDGTDVLASHIDSRQLVGVDFSEVAVAQAARRYPGIRFLAENWLKTATESIETYDVVFSSNTLEHFHRPYEVLQVLVSKARRAVVLALPYREMERIDEHFYSFLPRNVPFELSPSFGLVWSRVVDCRSLPDTLWGGDQIFLVYAESTWLSSLKLTLNDCEIGHTDIKSEITGLSQQVVLREGQIAGLRQEAVTQAGQIVSLGHDVVAKEEQIADFSQKLADHEGRIVNLSQDVVAKEGQIADLSQRVVEQEAQITVFLQYRADKEVYIAQLRLDLDERMRGISGMSWRVSQRLKRVMHYMRAGANLIRTRGVGGFAKALRNKIMSRQQGIHTNYIQPSGFLDAPEGGELTGVAGESQHLRHVCSPLLDGELVIITGVPFDDIGGGQRAAQLARCALKEGRKVIYVYIYKKFDFELNRHIESSVNIHGLSHLHIDETSPHEVIRYISSRATLLVELPHPAAMQYLRLFNMRGIRTVFELIDDWETSLGGDWFDLDVYRQFVAEAKCVVGTARLLVSRLHRLGRADALYLPNAANEYIFDKYKAYARPVDLPAGRRRVALYFGSLYGEWFAWDYLYEAATGNTDIDFVLIGDRPSGKKMPANVHMLGAKMIDELPGYLAYSDFGLLPFSPGKISDAVSPIKIFEYLFAGKPVVSTNLPEIIGYPGVLVANSPDEFSHLCSHIDVSDELMRDNDRFISSNSWFSRLDAVVGSGNAQRFHHTVSAVILIHNNKHIIGRCLESLLQHGAHYLNDVIVVDNASHDGGAEYVEANFPTVRVIRNPLNGCSSGRNLGVLAAAGKYLAFFDSDQWFTSSSFFEEALSILERDGNAGAVGWAAGWFDPARSDLSGIIADYCQNRAMNATAIRTGYRTDIGYLGTGGFFTPRSVFDATGGFDIAYDPTCFEDTDLSFKIKQLGFDVCYRDLTGIRHQPHQTTNASSGTNAYMTLFKRNADYFKKKWEEYPHFYVDYSA